MKKVVIIIAIVLVLLALSFGMSALIVKGICWAFSLDFSLKYAFGIWLVLWLVNLIFKRGGNG